MCLALGNDINQLYQQHEKHYQNSVAIVTIYLVKLEFLVLILFLTSFLSFKWIYKKRRTNLKSSWNHLMQLKIHTYPFKINSFAIHSPIIHLFKTHHPFSNAITYRKILRLPSTFLSSFCFNKSRIYLFINLLLLSLVYLQFATSKLKAPNFKYFFIKHFSSQFSIGYSFKSKDEYNVSPSKTNVSANESFDVSSNVQSFFVFLFIPSFLFLLYSFLQFCFSEIFLLSILASNFLASFFKSSSKISTLSSSKSTLNCQKSNLNNNNDNREPTNGTNRDSQNSSSYTLLPDLKYFLLVENKLSFVLSFQSSFSPEKNFIEYLSSLKQHSLTKDKQIKSILSPFKNCSKKVFILFVLLNTIIPCQSVIAKKSTLYTAGFFPLSGDKADLGLGILPAVQLALDDITDNNIIPGYKLDLVGNDTMCDAAVGMKTFFDMIFAAPKKLILFGDACPSVTDPIAKASRFFHLIQLSYADTHPMYTSDSYPNLFRIAPSQSAFNKARVALLQSFSWRRVGTIYENSPRYSLPHGRLLTELDLTNITIATTQSVSDGVQFELTKIKEKDVRIILGNFGESWARKLFCQAYRHGIYGKKYQWVIAGEYSEFWWSKNDTVMNCTKKEILKAIEGYLIIDVLPLSSSNIMTASGMTAAEYEEKYNYLRKEDYSKFHGYAYDGLWTIALAIKRAQIKLETVYRNTTLQKFEYRDPFWSKLFRDALNEVSFIGVTGNVSFFNNERRGSMVLKQFQNGREVKIGEYHSTTDNLDLSVGLPIMWGTHNNTPPLDRTIRENVQSRINLTLFVVISIFAILGILLALFFLFMNIKNRKQRYIKMSSPYLNNLIIIGCVLTYTSVILLGLDSRLLSEANFPYICTVLMTGFTLAFGSMFSKTYRVHAIFTDIKLNKKVIKDYKLFMVVGILVFIDVAILTTWQIVDPFYRQTSQGVPETTAENEDILIVPQLEFCQSKRMTIFLGSIYVYKGLLMAFGIFLAWETRQVSIPALNDSKYIGMSVYNVVIMCVIGAGLSVVLKDQQNAAFLIISIFIIFCSTATLCLVFVPKLIELKRNPNMDERRARPTLKPFKKSRRESDELELHGKIKNLSETNVRQRQRLKEKTYELEALMYRLRQINAEDQDQENLEKALSIDNAGKLIAKVNIENIPATTIASIKLPTKPIDSNRMSTNQQYGKQGCVVLLEEQSSSRSNDRETSFLSLSASASFISSNENCAIYAHQNPPIDRKQQQEKDLIKQKSDQQDQEPTAVEKRLLCTANSELLQEVLDGETMESLHLANQQRNSCPELYQIQQLFLSNDNEINKNTMEKLMMLNTTTITSAIIETDSSSELMTSSSSSSEISRDNLVQSRSSEQDNQFKKDHQIRHRKAQNTKEQLSNEEQKQHFRRRMVKAISQQEPLSLIEKVREIRFAVQRSLDAAENIGRTRQKTLPSSKQEQQKARKKRKEQSISSCIKKKSSFPTSDHSHLSSSSFYNHQDLNHLPTFKDQTIHTSTETHPPPIKSIHHHSSRFDSPLSSSQQYFETQVTYANDQLDYNLNLKDFKLKKEDEPLSCDHYLTSNSSSSSSSPSTMLGRPPIPKHSSSKTKTKHHDYSRKAKQIEEEDLDEENIVCSSAKKQRKSLNQQPLFKQSDDKAATLAIQQCNRHPFAIKRRAASLDQLQTNQLCTCSRHLHQTADYQAQQAMQLANITNLTNLDNISMIYRGPYLSGAPTDLPDSSLHFINNSNKMTTSITTHSIISHHSDSSKDRNQQSRLPMTSNAMLTSTFSSSPSIVKCHCDIIEYL